MDNWGNKFEIWFHMNGHILGRGGPLGPFAGGCGNGIGPPLFVGGIPGSPLNPGNIGKGSLIPGFRPNIAPVPSSFIWNDSGFCSHYNFFFIMTIRYLKCNQILAFEKA
jgi:hypothetical protein